MATPYAFVTLITSDSYLPGALALVAAIRDIHPSPPLPHEVAFQTVCLVTPETVDVSSIKLLRRAYDVVVGVEVIDQQDLEGLRLLGRLDLSHVLTKLHVFRLVQYSKVIFLDADVLPIRPLSHLFTLPHEFSAVPDVGWPDIFNSGMMVLTPGEEKFQELTELAKSKGSWDGGDQGLLNEWRGGNWNRLSFIYNTTPTAAYTYAPAYERFGSQIAAIHFIGPEKPWNSIPYRAPGSAAFQQSVMEQQRAYNYSGLVDRWYAVYDKHYRSQPSISSEFEVRQYTSAWDEQTGIGKETLTLSGITGGGVLGLEELKRIAVEGIGAMRGGGGNEGGFADIKREGEYRSLPMEGRVDLMRPRREEKPSQQDQGSDGSRTPTAHHFLGSPPRMGTMATLGPDEKHPRPQDQSQQHHEGQSYPPPYQQQHSEHHQPWQQHQNEPPQHHPSPQRPHSPPIFVWNPAVEPPPTTNPNSSFPTDTYFTNVWDQAPGKHHDVTYQSSHSSGPPMQEGPFFEPPARSAIPEHLIREGHYTNVIGHGSQGQYGAPPAPDPTKVKSVFPWEDKPRHAPGRVFPSSDALPPGAVFIESQRNPPPPQRSSPLGSPGSFKSARGFPSKLAYANAWDTEPNIQKWATKLVRPSQSSAAPPTFDDDGFRKGYKSWETKSDASSMDGDDEGADDDDDNEVASNKGDDSSRERSSRRRSRSGSEGALTPTSPRSPGSTSSSQTLVKERKKEYSAQGVQTIPREMRSKSVQVTLIGKSTKGADDVDQEPPLKPPQMKARGRVANNSTNKKEWPAITMQNVKTGPSLFSPALDSPALITPSRPVSTWDSGTTGMRSPRTFSPPMAGTPRGGSPTETFSQIRTSPPQKSVGSPQITRTSSNETGTSSTGPISPADVTPLASPPRKAAARVWDPARGVDIFKRGSEEVLARFLRMGPQSWDEDSADR